MSALMRLRARGAIRNVELQHAGLATERTYFSGDRLGFLASRPAMHDDVETIGAPNARRSRDRCRGWSR